MNIEIFAFRPGQLRSGFLMGAAVVAGLSLPARADYFDDFNSGTDPGWIHFDVSDAGVPGGPYGTYTFPSDGSGGFGYRINSYANPVPDQAGPGRAFSYRAAEYTRSVLSVDVLDWTSVPDVAFGILFRANDVGPGTTSGYVFNYDALDENLQLNPVAGEAAGDTLAEVSVLLDPVGQDYRFELSAWGPNFLGLIYQLPDTKNPIASVVATDSTTAGGQAGLFNFDRDGSAPAGALVASTTFDNFAAVVPPDGSLAAVAVELLPRPAGGVHEALPAFKAAVLNRETTVDSESFGLEVDGLTVSPDRFTVTEGVTVPNSTDVFPGATLSYRPSIALAAGVHTAAVAFADNFGVRHTNEWSFTADYFTAPASPAGVRGFNVRLTQALEQSQGIGNSLQRAHLQLDSNSPIAAAYTTNVVADVINYSQKAIGSDLGTDGNFDQDNPFPGQTDGGPTDNYAMEVTCWLDLPAGTTTFGVTSDDGFELTSSALAVSPILGRKNGGPADMQFSAYATRAGLYPFKLVWYENTGGAHLEWFVVKGDGEKVLLNSTGAPAAYTFAVFSTYTLLTARTLGGPFVDTGLYVVDLAKQTITTTVPNESPTFYRVSAGAGAVTITGIEAAGSDVVIRYQ